MEDFWSSADGSIASETISTLTVMFTNDITDKKKKSIGHFFE